MNIVDSSGWLEYFAGGANASYFEPAITKLSELLVPSVSLYEVFKPVYQQRGEGEALVAVALMQQGTVVDLDSTLAMSSAKISAEMKLPMADSIMLATARQAGAVLWTQDTDFEGMQGVRYVKAR
jgi:predicted nucleic acid-binding protein